MRGSGQAIRVGGSPSLRTSAVADRARARARSLALPLLVLVVPWQAWWRAGFLAQVGVLEEPSKQQEDQEEPPAGSPFPESPQPGSGASSLPGDLRLAVFDLAGTTLDDIVDGQPLAVSAICDAFEREGFKVSGDAVTPYRGLEKREAIARLYRELRGDVHNEESGSAMVERIYSHFLEALNEILRQGPLSEVPGTSGTFMQLRSRGVAIAISSGFPTQIMYDLVGRLGWQVDAVVPAQRPSPDAVYQAMRATGVPAAAQVVKVGDTVADVEEGRRAGVWTVAVLTGTQQEGALRAAGPDFVLSSVADIPGLLGPEVPAGPPTEAEAEEEEREAPATVEPEPEVQKEDEPEEPPRQPIGPKTEEESAEPQD